MKSARGRFELTRGGFHRSLVREEYGFDSSTADLDRLVRNDPDLWRVRDVSHSQGCDDGIYGASFLWVVVEWHCLNRSI